MSANLPLPPSINEAFIVFRRGGKEHRAKSPKYAAWQKDVVRFLVATCKPVEAERYAITIDLGINYRSDIDNRVKPVLDALVVAKMITDDRYVDRIVVQRDESVDGCRVTWSDASHLPVVTS